jgi:hypothetical protein
MKHFGPLSDSLIQKLKQCRLKETDVTGTPARIEEMPYAIAPLYKRGLIDIKKEIVENKISYFVQVTPKGVEYLEKLDI